MIEILQRSMSDTMKQFGPVPKYAKNSEEMYEKMNIKENRNSDLDNGNTKV